MKQNAIWAFAPGGFGAMIKNGRITYMQYTVGIGWNNLQPESQEIAYAKIKMREPIRKALRKRIRKMR